MMIRANGEYLDFDADIEIESQVKLFDDIGTSNGDFSYSFTLPKTNKNLSIIGLPFPDTIKTIYQNTPCEIVDDSGFVVYTGNMQVTNNAEELSCTFFGGNSDWFSLLSQPMSSLPLYKYDVVRTESTIQTSWSKNSGLVFPIIDAGVLAGRQFASLVVEDFVPMFYVNTLFKEIFNAQGIKLKGDLLKDSTFNNLLIACNNKSQEESFNTRSCYVDKTIAQNGVSGEVIIRFQDETTPPFFDGSRNNFSANTYTADVKIRVRFDVIVETLIRGNTNAVYVVKINGVSYKTYTVTNGLPTAVNYNLTKSLNIIMEIGDQLSIHASATGSSTIDLTGGTFKVTPTYSYGSYSVVASASVPNWTQDDFVSSILKIFNTIPSYNSVSKTLTIDLFNKITEKEAIDVSEDITITEIDYTSFVSNYSKNNLFSYQQSDQQGLEEYNISNYVSYGNGILTSDNDFLASESDTIESDFSAPITYLNNSFDMSMERIQFLQYNEVDELEITSVTNSSGTPRFNISNANNTFTALDIVRIDTLVDSYNGEWVVETVTSSYITVIGLTYDANATGTAILLNHEFTTDNNVYIFQNVPNVNNLFFSSISSYYLGLSTFSSTSIAFFNLLSNGRQINTKYKQSLSFGDVNDPLSYQRTILQTYWPIFQKILNDPVMLIANGYFNRNKFMDLRTFLKPIRVKTNQTNNLYYLNRITGYKSGSEPCEVELIKL